MKNTDLVDEIKGVNLSLKISDLFEHLHFSPNGFEITLNSSPAKLEDILKEGDSVEVRI